MRYLAILLFAVMAIGLTVCGCLLWQKREATGDRSRTLLALTGWAAAFMGVLYIFRTCADTLPVSAPLLANVLCDICKYSFIIFIFILQR